MDERPVDVPLVDMAAQRRRLGRRIDEAMAAVVDHGRFILGPEVVRLEDELARRCGVAHAIGCSSGTDALLLALMARGVGAGDAVFVPAFTFAATAEVVALVGATPVFVDVRDDTFNVDVARVDEAAAWAPGAGLRPAAVVAVDLFGQPADHGDVARVAADHGMWVLADAAQSFGASLEGRPVGSLAGLTATSFFPAKPLGCFGDGGAVFTDDHEAAARVRSLRAHGRGRHKLDHVLVGLNARLDTLQAAVLLVKLEIFDDELDRRRRVAARYHEALAGLVEVPALSAGATSAWACYTVRVAGRDRVARRLAEEGIASAVYYPEPLHHLPAYSGFPRGPGGLAVSERLCREVLSLPMHPYLDGGAQDRVVDALRGAVGSGP